MPKANFSKVRKFIAVFFGISLIFASGYFFGVSGYKLEVKKARGVQIERVAPPDKNVNFDLFWKVWDLLSARYFDKTKLVPSEMVYGAISGMVSSLGDPYTVFLSPKENKVVEEDLNGAFEGVGMQIGYKAARLAVIAPLPDSPAEEAGVKAGDYIVHIKDEAKNVDVNSSSMDLNTAVQLIRGKEGSKVTLTFVREGVDSPIVKEITRAKLEVPSVTLSFEGDSEQVAVLKVNKFVAETSEEWDKKVDEIVKNRNTNSIVIDLRNNPGGYLQEAVDLAGDFIDVGKVVVIEDHGDGTKIEHKVEKIGRLLKYKVVILTNGGSASASEILAGALRDQKQFLIIGETSFGKGTMQEPIDIPGGSGLHVTTARWLTPNGTWVNETGLEPNIKVSDDENTPEDEQLQKAIETVSK